MKTLRILACFLAVAATAVPLTLPAATPDDAFSWSQHAADAAITRWPDGRTAPASSPRIWNYEFGTLLEGMDAVWLNAADPSYFNYIQKSVDTLLGPDGSIPTLKPEEHQLDNILLGRQLLLLYRVTRSQRYLIAAKFLSDQLAQQPREPSGGYWHKQRYPNQMWLDGLYMAEPFRAEYASISHRPEDFADITHQFVLMEQHSRDPKTGLLYHGWDESKQERWANKQTGNSSEFWARGMGWYMMALVDTLDYFPAGDPGRAQLLAILQRSAVAVARYQDAKTGLWFDVLNKPNEKGNYLESSAACMFVYAFAKGVRMGYLPQAFSPNAERGYKGILSHFVTAGPDITPGPTSDGVSLSSTVKGSGLGGDPYRDGTFAYYIGEKVATNDPKGIGAFLLASSEMETAPNTKLGRNDTVLVDGWFNSQLRADAFGQQVLFHYKWNTWDEAGYSLFGHIFRNFGATTSELDADPTAAELRRAQVYLIVSPDNLDKNPHPHYANAEDAAQIAGWVHSGGVLMIMENDTSYADLDHFNVVSDKFGIHFNNVLRKHVVGTNWDQGKILIDGTGPIFHRPHTIYVKDVCTISVSGPAHAVLSEGADTFMATAKYGKGTVYAMVDPWLYNEYTDGRKLPAAYDNFAAGNELVRWVLDQIPPDQVPR
jgi:unsaturated rhamnogalacturonyl hydrolase